MTEKIDLGNNPFGAFLGTGPEEPTAAQEDVLPELMQLEVDAPNAFTAAPPTPKPTPVPAVFATPPRPVSPAREVPPPPPPTSIELDLAADLEADLAATPGLVAPSWNEPKRAEPKPTAFVDESEPAVSADAPIDPFLPRPPEPIDQRKLWLLRVLLASNLAMMLVMLLLPHPMETRTEYLPVGPSTSVEDGVARNGRSGSASNPAPARGAPEPYVQPMRPQSLGMPNDPLYEKALLMALEGDFAGATATLRSFLAAHPGLDPALERLVHAHLAYYLRKAGDLGDAIVHEGKARQMSGRAFLPEELLRSAREAELHGDGDGMRRAYAQFLLQEDQLPPALRALVQEHLKLGDAYRVEAERAERAASQAPPRRP